jgi:Protein of unknown function (DUF4232)
VTKPWSLTAVRVGAVVVTCGVLLGACGGGTGHHAAGPNGRRAAPNGPGATAPGRASPGTTSPPTSASLNPRSQRLASDIYAIAGPPVTFTGAKVTVFAQVEASTPTALAITRAGFGDGSGVITLPAAPCDADRVRRFGLVSSTQVSHRYARPGQHTIRIWARLGCGTGQPVQYNTATVYAYPSAPPAAASWPRCQPGQLTATLTSMGAATGNVGVDIVLRNVSAVPCHLYGFPGLQMLSASGAALPTTAYWGGSYLFPALRPHLVGLAPGQKASFDLAYGDNPTGNPPPPYQQACPTAAALVIIPPDDFTSLTTAVTIAPCNGDLSVSPVVPGTAHIPFS